EAMTLADRIAVLNRGELEQVGAPGDLYARPDNLFVARFLGTPEMNVIEGEIAGGRFVPAAGGALSVDAPGCPEGPATLGVRAEDILAGPAAGAAGEAPGPAGEAPGPAPAG